MHPARIAALVSILTLALGCSMFFPHAPLSSALVVIQRVLLVAGAVGLAGALLRLALTR